MSVRRLEYLPIDDLRENPANPKLHAAEISQSIERFGYVDPVIVDERTGMLVAGHGRKEALQALEAAGGLAPDGIRVKAGRWLVPVVRGWSSSNDDEANAMLFTSNRLVERGGWDDELLAAGLKALEETEAGLDGTGFDHADVEALLISVAAHERSPVGERDEGGEELEPPRSPRTVRGDVWLLGPHRLLCGDCREPSDVAQALAGATVNVAITSPPYADRRDYDETSGFRPINPDEYVDWFAPVAENVAAHIARGGSWFVNIKPGAEGLDTSLYVLDLVAAHVRQWGWHFATEFCWERPGVPKQPVLRFKNAFEPIYQFTRDRWKFRPNAVRHPTNDAIVAHGPGRGNTSWADPKSAVVSQGQRGDLFEGQRVRKRRANHSTKSLPEMQGTGGDIGSHLTEGFAYPSNRLPTFSGSHEATGHTAAFPVGLPEFFIAAYSDEGDVVYDPFMGSGSTLLAAQRKGRIGIGIELSPGYCDVTCRRFQRLTDIKPVLERTGEPRDFG